MLDTPDTRDLVKTRSGKLSYQGLVPGKKAGKGLYVGSVVDSASTDFMRKHNIHVVVNCTRDLPFRFTDHVHMRLPVDDAYTDTLPLFELWKTAIPRISRHIDKGHNVLIHCHCAQQRSIATAAAVLMYREGLDTPTVVKRLKRLKTDAFWPRINFHRSLLRWQGHLKKKFVDK